MAKRPSPAVAALLTAVFVLVAAGCSGHAKQSAAPAPTPATSALSEQPSTDASSAAPATSANPTPTGSKPTGKSTPTSTLHPGTGGTGPAGSMRLTGSTTVALTFDDGPDPVTTPKLLALLRQYHVHATFCVIGDRARDYPDLIRQIVADGHTLCNHSWQHLEDLGKRDFSYQNWDLRSSNDAIHNASPGVAINYFRAPGGNFTTGLVQLATDLGMKSLYWDVDPEDWNNPKWGTGPSMVNHVVSVVEHTVRPGSIILSHDRAQHPDTVTAYQTLLPWLLARYQLEPLP